MSGVFAVRYIKLRPRVKLAEYEAFITQNVPTLPALPGTRWYVAKGDQGDRAGCFVLIYKYVDIALRDHYSPEDDTFSIEALEYLNSLGEFIIEVDKYSTSFGALVLFTDYAVIAEF